VIFVPLGCIFLWIPGPQYLADGVLALLFFTAGFFPYDRAMLLMTEIRLRGSQGLLAASYALSQIAFLGASYAMAAPFGAAGVALGWALGQLLLVAMLSASLKVTARAVA
jgi:hypothetical protein